MAVRPLTLEELAHIKRGNEKEARRKREAAEREHAHHSAEQVKKLAVAVIDQLIPDVSVDVTVDASVSIGDVADTARGFKRRKQ